MKNVKKKSEKAAVSDEAKKTKSVKAKKVKAPKAAAPKKAEKSPKDKKPKVKVYNISGKFKADSEGNMIKSSKNLAVEYVKSMTGTGKPGFMVRIAVHSK